MKRTVSIIAVGVVVTATAVAMWWFTTQQSTPSRDDTTTTPTTQPASPPKTDTSKNDPVTKPFAVYYIAEGDNGVSGTKVGCGDSLVEVKTDPITTTTPVVAALENLLANKAKNIGQSGLYNALYQSDLKVDTVSTQAGTTEVKLSGEVKLGGECDIPRVKAQLTSTAKATAGGNTTVVITINGQPLDAALSLK